MPNHRSLLLSLVVALTLGWAATAGAHDPPPADAVDRAVAVLRPIGQSGVSGVVYFARQGDEVKVEGKIVGLKPGEHGFHVHQYGDLTDLKEGKSAGSHYNPTNMPHGRRMDAKRHVGDLGNIVANKEGVATFEFVDPVIRLNGPHAVIGRGLVVHGNPDQFTQPQGDAGPRVAIGVIGIAQPKP